MQFPRIRDMREDHDLTQKKVAKYLGIGQRTYSNYERGSANIPAYCVKLLSKLYYVSADYLLGTSDDPKPYPPKK